MANLDPALPDPVAEVCERFTGAGVDDPAGLAARLWDLDAWATTARDLLAETRTEDRVLRFTACATAGRHLLSDPVLPADLLPDG